ncbi:hypothetical protein H6G83_00010 [Anabaena azotica FACHB-119]|uniref:Uncharacterized protein n=2 Tax=Anabaena azotica TaxID=197653 RepID=A0ABR8CVQ8_9NOST|nr:hypothetical protein [Anabaena azotica FACHB-119]
MQWLKERQQLKTTRQKINSGKAKSAAETKASELRSSLPKKKIPTATSAVVDVSTGKVYYATSGRPYPQTIHPLLQARMPNPSLETWPVNNCAEFKAVNQALLDGAKITNLEVHTVRTQTGEAFSRCANCQITTEGATITSDIPQSSK